MGALKSACRYLLTITGLLAIGRVAYQALRANYHFPIPDVVNRALLNNPAGETLLAPLAAAERTGVKPGEQVLELGEGAGYATFALAELVGNSGKLTVQVEKAEKAEELRQRAFVEGADNLEFVVGEARELELPGESFDRVVLMASLGKAADKYSLLWEAFRLLKVGGQLSLTEIVLDPAYMLKSSAVELCEQSGFYLVEELGSLAAYTVNFRKPPRGVAS